MKKIPNNNDHEASEVGNEETPTDPVATGSVNWAAAAEDMTFADEGDVAEVQGAVALRKPGKERFFQASNNAAYSTALTVLEIKEDLDLRGDYLVPHELSAELRAFLHGQQSMIKRKNVILCVDGGGHTFVWPVAAVGSDNQWHRSARKAADEARSKWIRMIPANSGYRIFHPTSSMPEPEWPDAPFGELLDSAFEGRVIDSMDHPVIEYLAGEGQVSEAGT